MPDFWPDELDGNTFEDTGYRGRYIPTPDGLDRRCMVCKAPKGELCRNPITGKPRRGGVSCIGRVERSPVSPIQTDRSDRSAGESGAVTGHLSEEGDRGRG